MIVAAGAIASSGLALLSRAVPHRRIPTPAWLLVSAAVYSILQAVPLPFEWLTQIAPANADTWGRALKPLGLGPPERSSLSLDPGASLVEALKYWTYAAVFVAAAAAGARRGARYGGVVLWASGLTLAMVTVGHALVDAKSVYGIYKPVLGGVGFGLGPLINPNNLAGYLNLGLLCAAGLLADDEPPVPRWVIGIAIAPMTAVSLLTGSRAGAVSLILGVALFLLLLMRLDAKRTVARVALKRVAVAGGLAVLLGISYTLLASTERVGRLLFQSDTSKLDAFAASIPLITEHAWFGIGRGAFESVFPAYHAAGDNTIFSHSENFIIQWASEWGIPVTVVLLILFAWLLRPSEWGLRTSAVACGMFSGVTLLVVHNLLDLGFELPGVFIAVIAACGFVWGEQKANSTRRFDQNTPTETRTTARIWGLGHRKLRAAAATTAGLGLLALVLAYGRNTLALDRARVLAAMPQEPRATSAWLTFRNEVSDAIRRHPADPYFPRLGALVAWRSGTENPLPWIQRALERGLSAGRTHYLLGAYLASLGRRHQALLELRLAMQFDPQLTDPAVQIALSITRNREELAQTVPIGKAGARTLTALARRLRAEDPEGSTLLLAGALERDPGSFELRSRYIRGLLSAVDSAEQHCAESKRAPCLDQIHRQLERFAVLHPSNNDLFLLRAHYFLSANKPEQALSLLTETCVRIEKPLPCIERWVEAGLAMRDRSALTRAIEAIELEPCTNSRECAKVLWNTGKAAAALGDVDLALRQYERAAEQEGSVNRWLEVSRLSESAGQYGRALRALSRATLMRPGDISLHRKLDATRQRLLSGQLSRTNDL